MFSSVASSSRFESSSISASSSLMVFWSLGEEPDALVLDELFVDSDERVIH
jgi:hypothetical protein